MHRLQRFFTTVTRSAYDRSFYAENMKEPAGNAIGHLYMLLVVVALLFCVPAAVGIEMMMPAVRSFVADQKDVVRTWYPQELVLTAEGDAVSANVEQPYFIELPTEWHTALGGEFSEQFDHFVTIDTEADAGDFLQYRTVVLLTDTAVVFAGDNGQYRVQPFGPDAFPEKLVLDQKLYQYSVDEVWNYMVYLPVSLHVFAVLLLLVLPWVMAGGMLLGYLAFLLFATLLTWCIAWLCKRPKPYWMLFRLGCYGLTLALFYNVLANIFGFYIPFAFTCIFLAWMTAVIVALPAHAPTAKRTPAKKKTASKR